MNVTQSNTLLGTKVFNSGADLSLKEGRLVKVVDGGTVTEVLLPAAITDLALYVLDEGGIEDQPSTVIPLEPGREMRVRAEGTGSAGAILVLADPTASSGVNAGKVVTIPATQGVYFSPGIAEEDFVDEQLVKIRPNPRLVYVGSAFSGTTPAATGATNSSPYGFTTAAQANDLVTTVREVRAFMTAVGWKS